MDTRYKNKKETLQQVKERLKSNKDAAKSTSSASIENVYENAEKANGIIRKQTGVCFDDRMSLHECEWDRNYPENPQRYHAVIERCTELGLFDRCVRLGYDKLPKEKILKKHTADIYDKLENMDKLSLSELEEEATKYDAVYFNKHTFECASIAAGCVLSIVENVCREQIQNGMAIVRPPGHHAMTNDYCGYCFFNNVALAAQEALDNKWAEKILIVDYDVHHGQATQQMFYENDRVLYFSIHRYENGTFWPNLRESHLDYVGAGKGLGYNINFPLNSIGMNDIDYLAIVFHILLPVAYEYNPDIIIFSAGYDACLGCPEGEMRITPGFYGHLVTLLSGLANGKLAVCMEGGYFTPSLAEGVAMTIKALLDDAPAILDTSQPVHPCIIDVINSLKATLRPYWKCFQAYKLYEDGHDVDVSYLGTPLVPPYETRDCYLVKDDASIKRDTDIIVKLRGDYNKIKNGSVCYAYDDIMLEHDSKSDHPENSLRLKKIHEMFHDIKLNERCVRVESKAADIESIKLIHNDEYINSLLDNTYEPKYTDIYFNSNSLNSILTSTGCLLSLVDSIMLGPHRSGAAFIRPPGHHALSDEAQGFCFISNVAVAAKYILKNNYAKKILIVDFDIHHGNGTQSAFYDSDEVLYISIHKYNYGQFFPFHKDANYDKIGAGKGAGFNVNIPFNKNKMTDSDYIAVFHRLVLPISYSYSPDVVIISAGFDAGVRDTIGNYSVSPEAFGHFVQLLKPLAGGKLILALEGGYNVNTLAFSMNMCVKVLLGDPLPKLAIDEVNASTTTTIENVITCQKAYWPILDIDKKLKEVTDLTSQLEQLNLS
ncbi:Histone deacetylase domain [Popillia japonica]|uniref:Histone deacetylase domain n=1 Tax=Popillia japonica TaxID=7064 RepID=A0AAW1KU65_POPJA